MKNPLLNKPLFLNIIILVVAGFVSWFTLLFGFAHLIEGLTQPNNPNTPTEEVILGSIMVLILCLIGIACLLLTIAAIKAVIFKIKKR